MMEEKKVESHENDYGHVHNHPVAKRPMNERFTALLLQWASSKRPKTVKPYEEMTEEERKVEKIERNHRRKYKAKAAKAAKAATKRLGNKPPKPNQCRRRRLAAKHPDRKGRRK